MLFNGELPKNLILAGEFIYGFRSPHFHRILFLHSQQPSILLGLIGMFLHFGAEIKEEDTLYSGQVGSIYFSLKRDLHIKTINYAIKSGILTGFALISYHQKFGTVS